MATSKINSDIEKKKERTDMSRRNLLILCGVLLFLPVLINCDKRQKVVWWAGGELCAVAVAAVQSNTPPLKGMECYASASEKRREAKNGVSQQGTSGESTQFSKDVMSAISIMNKKELDSRCRHILK